MGLALLQIFFFGQILVEIVFGLFFFFCLKVEQIIYFILFFNLRVFLIFIEGWENGWEMGRGGWLSNVGGAYLFFLHSLMGIFFFFFCCKGHGPPKPLCGSAPVAEGVPLVYKTEKHRKKEKGRFSLQSPFLLIGYKANHL